MRLNGNLIGCEFILLHSEGEVAILQRLFIALELSKKQIDELDTLQMKIKGYLEGLRWAKPEEIHLTLKFLGETDEHKIDQIKKAMDNAAARISHFQSQFGGCGVFPSAQKARVIWIGIKEGSASIRHLAEMMENNLSGLGFEPEKRDYNPHLTMARLRYPLSDDLIRRFLDQENSFETSTTNLNKVVLFNSNLTRHGAVHTPIYKAYFQQDIGTQ